MRRLLRYAAWFFATMLAVPLLALLYLMWNVRDVPVRAALFPDCEITRQTKTPTLVANPEWRTRALRTVEPRIDSYLSSILISNSFPPERGVFRLLQQAAFAPLLKLKTTKDERTDIVLRSLHYGSGTVGLNCAAAKFFNKQPDELSIAEFAVFTGMIKAPSIYDPIQRPDKSRERRDQVIQIWLDNGLITESDAQKAIQEKLL